MHRKFIAFVVASAMTITGISASQAQAADGKDILGGLAAIALLGVAINHFSKQEPSRPSYNVTRQPAPVYKPKVHKPHGHKPHAKPHHVRPLPKSVAKYNLPQRCLRTFKGAGHHRPLLGERCLGKHYKHASSLPYQCKVGFWNGKRVNRGYEPACLRQYGYRVVY
ncbi:MULTISPECIES: hypothetical protein [unclassified Ruegeria]|uniref:hypothetical protein n=1 Tax=unclassified Ruegeria TaxID=2625375 RepID=UPI001487E8DD|nr:MULTISPECIES: hypothetical protein [unclassified Ruegeria]